MKSQLWILCLLLAVSLTGCQSDRAPSFVNSDDIEKLVPAARDVAVAEVDANFGSPSNLVVASYLNVDFGTYSGTVEKVNLDGTYQVRLIPESTLASEKRMPELKGAAVTIAAPKGEAAAAEDEAPTDNTAAKSDETDGEAQQALQVVSFSINENQDGGEGVVGDLTVASVDESAVSVEEGDVVNIIGDALQQGRDLYLRHCMHCHGVGGDGAGPTAEYFTIKPRDYRLGKFKFTSTKGGVRASRDDLYRVIKLGIPGTYMPSFMLLPDDESRALVEYVRWLAMRGEMEGMLAAQFSDFGVDRLEEEGQEAVEKEFQEDWDGNASEYREQFETDLTTLWTESEDEQNVVWPLKKKAPDANPPELELIPAPRQKVTLESIANGRRLFMHKDIACFSCHGEKARGNGVSTETLNDKTGQPGVKNEKPGLYDDWGNLVKPRDLTSGIFRGGRRPIDIYRRIHTGIKGTPMQGFGGKSLDGGEIWDIVNYVLSIPVHGADPETGK